MAGILCNRPYLRLESCIWKYELLCINCWLFMFYVLDDKLSCMFTLCHFVLDNTYYLFFALIFVTSICWVITVYYKPFSIMSYLLKLFFFLCLFLFLLYSQYLCSNNCQNIAQLTSIIKITFYTDADIYFVEIIVKMLIIAIF